MVSKTTIRNMTIQKVDTCKPLPIEEWLYPELGHQHFCRNESVLFYFTVFEMVAMPFPCNGLTLCWVNLPWCFSINLLHVLSLISIFLYIYWGWPSFGLTQFLMVDSYCATNILWVAVWYIKKRRRKKGN